MTIQGPKPGGWASNELLTSAQMTALQTAIERALDGVGGGNYNIAGNLIVTFTGANALILQQLSQYRVNSQVIGLRLRPLPAQVQANWTWSPTQRWTQSGNTGGSISFPIPVLPQDIINSVTVTFDGGPGHGALPAVMPRVRVMSVSAAGGTVTHFDGSDDAASVGAYEAQHFVQVGDGEFFTPTDESFTYLVIDGESGANAQPGLQIVDCHFVVTRFRIASDKHY